MDYVDTWYTSESVLPQSIYSKRAASSTTAVLETLRRRAAMLSGSQAARVEPVAPRGFDRFDLAGAEVESDEAWRDAEQAVVQIRRRGPVCGAGGRQRGHRSARTRPDISAPGSEPVDHPTPDPGGHVGHAVSGGRRRSAGGHDRHPQPPNRDRRVAGLPHVGGRTGGWRTCC
jgi:hypothetical protein